MTILKGGGKPFVQGGPFSFQQRDNLEEAPYFLRPASGISENSI
ncbi:hypothetical protein [Paenibacillus paeoniae]|nr:hypothetical protein [Paenibacillus paeoniae]